MSDDKTYDSSNEKDVAKAKRKEHNEIHQEIADLSAIMETKQGRSTMWRLLSRCHVFASTFNKEHAVSSFKEGERNIGLYYLQLLNEHCLENYQKMEREQRTRKQ